MAYSRKDVRNLFYNMIEPKIQRILDSILRHSKSSLFSLFNVTPGDKSDPLHQSLDSFFEWQVLDCEMLRHEYHQHKLTANSDQVRLFCKGIIGLDIVATEITRLGSVFGLSQKFRDKIAG